jgi:hypothetical protein
MTTLYSASSISIQLSFEYKKIALAGKLKFHIQVKNEIIFLPRYVQKNGENCRIFFSKQSGTKHFTGAKGGDH